MTEEMRRSAEREAEMRLAEVEIRAEKILDASHRRAARLSQDIRDMRALRTRLGQALRSAAETHLSILETLEADPEPGSSSSTKAVASSVAYLKAKPRADVRAGFDREFRGRPPQPRHAEGSSRPAAPDPQTLRSTMHASRRWQSPVLMGYQRRRIPSRHREQSPFARTGTIPTETAPIANRL